MIKVGIDDPRVFAERLNLRYVCDSEPGGTRRKRGRGFSFLDDRGVVIRSRSERTRFEMLAIPPAWRRVWICLDPNGHLQATGHDGRGRKQYRYHPIWSESANRAKFDALIGFGESLPSLRRRVCRDLKRQGLDRRRILATIVRILDRGFLRLGNDAYTATNRTFGATTLRPRHVHVDDDRVEVSFIGKHHRERSVELSDPSVAEVIDQLAGTNRRRLFRYRQGGAWHDVRSAMVNEYLAALCGDGVTAKWFRTWHGSRLMLEELRAAARTNPKRLKRHLTEGYRRVAAKLGNRPATCRRYYVHPAIAVAYLDGTLDLEEIEPVRGLRRSEALLLQMVRRRSPAAD